MEVSGQLRAPAAYSWERATGANGEQEGGWVGLSLLLLQVVMLLSVAEAVVSRLIECSQTSAHYFVSCQPNTFTAPHVSVVFRNPFRFQN